MIREQAPAILNPKLLRVHTPLIVYFQSCQIQDKFREHADTLGIRKYAEYSRSAQADHCYP
jgi:hypothetical protein